MNLTFDEKGEISNYTRKIRKMYNDYEDLVFWLSMNSNESVDSIKKMKLGERINFQNRLTKHIQEQNKRSQTRGTQELE